jgi:hypothetical protein
MLKQRVTRLIDEVPEMYRIPQQQKQDDRPFNNGAIILFLLFNCFWALYEIGCFTFGLKETQHRWCEIAATVKH